MKVYQSREKVTRIFLKCMTIVMEFIAIQTIELMEPDNKCYF